MRGLIGFLTLLLAAGCDDQRQPEVVRTGDFHVSYDYVLDLPPRFVQQQDVQGIDSKVEEFRSTDVVISTDLGHYSSPPKCEPANMACAINGEKIAERNALVALYGPSPNERQSEPKPYRVFVHVPVDEPYGLALNLFARCNTKAACDDALRHFRRVRLIRQPRAPVAWDLAPPPPPPPVPRQPS